MFDGVPVLDLAVVKERKLYAQKFIPGIRELQRGQVLTTQELWFAELDRSS